MTLRTSLVLSGSDEGASAALKSVEGGMARAEKAAAELAAANARVDTTTKSLAREQAAASGEIGRAKAALAAGTINAVQYNAALLETKTALGLVERQHRAAVGELAKIGAVATASLGATRAGYVNLGRQAQDIGIQLQNHTNIGTIIAQQGGQVVDALQMMSGGTSKFAAFMGGPWGIALGIGVTALGFLISSLANGSEKSDELEGKTLTLHDALQQAAAGSDEARKALRDYNAEQDKARKNTEDMIELNLRDAEARYKQAIATREQLKAELDRQVGYGNDPHNFSGEGDANSQSFVVAGAQSKLNDQNAKIAELSTTVFNLRIQKANRDGKAAADPTKAINNKYDDLEAAANRAAAGNNKLTFALGGTIGALEKQRKAALAAQQALDHPGRGNGRAADNAQFGSPVSGYTLTGKFGENRGDHKHAGLDMAVKVGTPVYAAQDGLVSFAGSAGAYGNLVKLNHGAGTETRYGHLSRFAVSDNQQVQKGDLLGYSGGAKGAEGAGDSKGPHLHYEVRINGKAVDPTKGLFPIDASTVADRAQTAADALAAKQKQHADEIERLGNRSAESIARITEQWDMQPKAIDGAMQSVRGLNKTMGELGDALVNDASLTDAQRDSFAQMYKDAQAGKTTIVEGLLRPFEDLNQQSERRLQLQTLETQGRYAEANALQDIWGIEEKLGTQDEIRAQIAADIAAGRTAEAEALQLILDHYPQLITDAKSRANREQAVTEELNRQREIMGQYLDASRSVKQELVSIFSGTGSAGSLNKIFKQLNSQALVEKIFGQSFRDFDKWLQGQSGLSDSVDHLAGETDRAGTAAGTFADAVNAAAAVIRNPQLGTQGLSPGSGIAKGAALTSSLFSKLIGSNTATADEIKVVGHKIEKNLSPDDWAKKLSGSMTDAFAAALPQIFGGKIGKGVLGGALYGNMAGGSLGAIVGGLSGIPGLGGLANVIPGIGQANMLFDVAQSFGIKVPSAAKYGLIPSLLSSIFGKRARGGASVSSDAVGAHANDSGITGSLNETGGNIQSTIAQIAGALGASVGAYSIGIGRYKDYYQVSSNPNDPKLGNSYFGRDSKNSLYDGLDPAAAMKAALAGAIGQGAIQGISAAMQKALSSSSDIQKGIDEALKVHEVELAIGGIGAQLADQFKSFEKQAAERVRIAQQYGFDVAKIEAKNAEDRAKLLKDMLAQQVGSLQSLIDEMTSGSLFEGSAVDQRQVLLDKIATAKADAAAGKDGAADTLAQLLTQLNSVSKEVYGSTGGFAQDRSTILDTARNVIAAANQRITDAKGGSDPALTTTNAALDENNSQNAQIIAELETNNLQIQQLVSTLSFNGGGSTLRGLARTSPEAQ